MVALICMVGNDYQRIIDGINHWKTHESIEAIYLFFDRKKDKYGFASQRNLKDLCKVLNQGVPKPVAVDYNPQSYKDVFCSFYGILKKEVEKLRREALIDATSTTKEAYGAIVTVSLMFKKVRIYIVPPMSRGWYVPSPEDPVFEGWFLRTRRVQGLQPQEIYLPGERLKQPNSDEGMVLLKLLQRGGSSDTLASIMKWCNLKSTNPVVKNRFSRLIRRLEKKGFIEKRPSRTGKEVSLTQFGRIYAEAMDGYSPRDETRTQKRDRLKRL